VIAVAAQKCDARSYLDLKTGIRAIDLEYNYKLERNIDLIRAIALHQDKYIRVNLPRTKQQG